MLATGLRRSGSERPSTLSFLTAPASTTFVPIPTGLSHGTAAPVSSGMPQESRRRASISNVLPIRVLRRVEPIGERSSDSRSDKCRAALSYPR